MADREVLEGHFQVNEIVKCEASNCWGLNSGSVGGKTHVKKEWDVFICDNRCYSVTMVLSSSWGSCVCRQFTPELVNNSLCFYHCLVL